MIAVRALARPARSASAERLHHVIDAIDWGIWDWDRRRGSLFLSRRALEMLGYEPGRAGGAAWAWTLVHPDDAPGLRHLLEVHVAGEAPILAGEARLRAASGAYRWLHLRAKLVERGEAGEPMRLVGTAVDVTERIELRSRLVLADRVAALGTLAAGLSHEINNPLSYVLGNLGYAVERLPQVHGPEDRDGAIAADVREALLEAQRGADRVRAIVGDLKAFAGGGETNRPVDLGAVVASAVHLARHAVKRQARVVVETAPVPPVLGNAAQLGHLVLNLLLDAAQALPEGAPAPGTIRVKLEARGPARVALAVSDTGAGIPPEALPRLFDPFFTTRQGGLGAGLGLAISHAIVTSLGGEIAVESAVGRGSTFTVLLPAFGHGDAPRAA